VNVYSDYLEIHLCTCTSRAHVACNLIPHSHSYQSDSVLMYLIQLEHPWQGGAMRRRGRSNWWTLKIWPHLQRVWRKQILDLKAGLDFVEAIAQQ